MGSTVKILTYTVVVKEVSSCSVGGGEKNVERLSKQEPAISRSFFQLELHKSSNTQYLR